MDLLIKHRRLNTMLNNMWGCSNGVNCSKFIYNKVVCKFYRAGIRHLLQL